jgi:hypothetical protein
MRRIRKIWCKTKTIPHRPLATFSSKNTRLKNKWSSVNPSNSNSVLKIHISRTLPPPDDIHLRKCYCLKTRCISQILARFGSHEALTVLLPPSHNTRLNVTAFPPSNHMSPTRSCRFPVTCTSQNIAAPGPLTLLKTSNLRTKCNSQHFSDFTPQEPVTCRHLRKVTFSRSYPVSKSCTSQNPGVTSSNIFLGSCICETRISQDLAVFSNISCWIRATCVQLISILFVSSSYASWASFRHVTETPATPPEFEPDEFAGSASARIAKNLSDQIHSSVQRAVVMEAMLTVAFSSSCCVVTSTYSDPSAEQRRKLILFLIKICHNQ